MIGGWTYREAVVIVGLFTFVQGFIGAFLRPNLNRIAEAVRLGTMDFTLLKPIDTQFLVSAREVNVFRLADMLIGLGITAWAISGFSSVHAPGLALGLVLLIAALLIVYALWFILSTTAFWFVNVANVTELFSGVFQAGQFPVTAFLAGSASCSPLSCRSPSSPRCPPRRSSGGRTGSAPSAPS